MFQRNRHLVMFEQPGEGTGGAGGTSPGRLTAAELMARYGASPERLAEQLETARAENFDLRAKNRRLTADADGLRGQVPAEGAVVLTGDQAAAWAAYQALGAPTEVQQRLTAAETSATELATLKRTQQLADVAGLVGFKPAVLQRLGGDLEYETREVQVEGQARRVPHVKKADGTLVPLAEYASSEWADFLPSLQASGGGQGTVNGVGQGQGAGNGTTYPAQGGGRGNPAPTGAQIATNYVTNTYKGPPKTGG